MVCAWIILTCVQEIKNDILNRLLIIWVPFCAGINEFINKFGHSWERSIFLRNS